MEHLQNREAGERLTQRHHPVAPSRLECCDIYGNQGGAWTYNIVDQPGVRGNFSACPSFCRADAEPYDFCLRYTSRWLPGNHPDGYDCSLIGASGQACMCGPSTSNPTTWSTIKSLYR